MKSNTELNKVEQQIDHDQKQRSNPNLNRIKATSTLTLTNIFGTKSNADEIQMDNLTVDDYGKPQQETAISSIDLVMNVFYSTSGNFTSFGAGAARF